MNELNFYTDAIGEFVINFGPKLIGAIVTLIIGLWIVKRITNAISSIMEKKNIDSSLRPFLISLISIALKIFLIISVLSMVGIAMTSFVAIIGAAGLAVGLALSGTLQNFAGGVIILILKPFKVGDFIEAQGYSGSVSSILIFNTILKTPDNKTIIVPNGGLATGSLINYSTEPTRRVDWSIGISYGEDVEKARGVLLGIFEKDQRILKDPAPFIQMSELADSSVNLAVRVWVNTEDFWAVKMENLEEIYKTFNQEGISFPFPQMDVHLHQQQ